MKIILLKSVPKVGIKGEVVDTAPGYAAHALFPKKLAIPATPQALAALQQEKDRRVSEEVVRHALLDKAITSLNGMDVDMPVTANKEGNLFSKIHPQDIAKYILNHYRVSIDPMQLSLPEGMLKKLGTYKLTVRDGKYEGTFALTLVQK